MVGFAILAIYFALTSKNLKKTINQHDIVQKRRLYEIAVLKTIQDRIGYSLDVERVIDTLTGSLKNLFPYSTVSSLILHAEEVIIKTTLEEKVGTQFLEQVKKSMLASMSSLATTPLPQHVEEIRTGLVIDDTNPKQLASFFHIPLIVNGQIVGLISICSTKPGLYKEEDMTIMYQLTATASNALSRLRALISNEQEKLTAMITSLADGIVMIDNTYKLTFINQSARNLIGIPHLSNPTIFDVVNMLSKEKDFGAKIKEALSQNKIIEEKELHLGDETVAQVIVTPVLGAVEDTETLDRKVMGVTVLIHDITLEKGLQQMKEDFTNAVVHELRSPLTAIKAASEMMVSNAELPASDKKLATIIEQQSKRLLNDINSLLDAAKLEAGHFTVWQAPFDMSKVATETISLFQPEAIKKQITITYQVEDALPLAFIDSSRMAQVLNNLLSNSLKFTPAGGKITIKIVGQYNNQLPTTPTNPGILVSVSDTGIGIPQDKQKQLFTKFASLQKPQMSMRADHGQQPEITEGTGLGLFIAKGIVEAHGGNIYVNSTPEHGTTIFFTLPVAHEEAKTLLNPKLQSVLEQYTPKVLN